MTWRDLPVYLPVDVEIMMTRQPLIRRKAPLSRDVRYGGRCDQTCEATVPRRLEVETPLLRGGVVVYRKWLPSCGARPWRRDLVKRLRCTSLCIDNRWNGERWLYHHVVEGNNVWTVGFVLWLAYVAKSDYGSWSSFSSSVCWGLCGPTLACTGIAKPG